MTGPGYDRYHHLAACCPPWCCGHGAGQDPVTEGEHASLHRELKLSLADKVPDYVAVSTWQDPGHPAATVSLMHGAKDYYLPDMTPGEALALAVTLARAARDARSGTASAPSADPDGCPSWCEIAGDHEDMDGGDMHHALCEALQLSGYPYDVQDTRHHHSLLVTRRQIRNGEPVILIEKPDGDADDPEGIMEVPDRQVMISTGDAVEIAVSLLDLAVDPEALLAMRAS